MIEIRPYQTGDEQQILDLYHQTLNPSMDLATWHWKFKQNPNGQSRIYLAFDRTLCIGQYALMPMSIQGCAGTFTTFASVDSMVAPSHQRQGVLSRLEATASSNFESNTPCYTFLNENSYQVYLEKFGWTSLGAGEVYCKPLLSKLFERRKSKELSLNLAITSSFDSDIQHYMLNSQTKVGYTLASTPDNLNWRIFQSPHPYKVYKIEMDEQCIGLVIVRIQSRFGFRIAWVMDLHSSNPSLEVTSAIFSLLQKHLQERCHFLAQLLPNQSWIPTLKKAGFYLIPQQMLPHRFYFCVKPHQSGPWKNCRRDNWHLSWSMHDAI